MSRGYRALLAMAPRRARALHAREMEDLFDERLRDARGRGRTAVLAVWIRATGDLLKARLIGDDPSRAALTVFVDERTTLMSGSEIRYAWRSLWRQRGASALVVGMLALAIAGNVAVFSLINGLFLRPFPLPEPNRLVYINETAPRWNLDVVGVNYPDFDRWRKDAKLFESMALYQVDSFNLSSASGAERVEGADITRDFPRVLGVEPLLGRTFTPDEDKPKGRPVLLLSEGLWRERFGADPHVVGKVLKLDGAAHTIVGVMPAAASFPSAARLWVPMAGDPNQDGQSYSAEGIGRLRPGATAQAADADLKRAHQPIWDKSDKDHAVSPFVHPLRDQFVSDFRTVTSTVGGAVALLLLIACANVAAVMLARALARRREMGIRLALGSSRLRLMRQLLIENVMLAVAGGAIGLIGGRWALAALIRLIPDELPRWAAFSTDARVVGFSLGVVLVTAILFGWAPALHAVGGDLRSAVSASPAGTTGPPRGRRTLWILVGGEFALAAMLLVCATLIVKAFDRVRHVDPGFREDRVLTFVVPLSESTRPKKEQWVAFWDDLIGRAAALPGVDAAGLVSCPPLGCHMGNFFTAEQALPRPDKTDPVILTRVASPGYLAAMGLRLREGRFLQEPDGRPKHAQAVVVNETFVRTFWGDGATGVGRRIRYHNDKAPWISVVGVVADVKHYGLDKPMRPGIYFPIPQLPLSVLTVALHTAGDPRSLVPAAREMLRQMDPDVPLFGVKTMDEAIGRSLAMRAALSWMLAVFASLAFMLAIGGAYGVATYLVTQRTREIGIRVALGASTADIFRGVVVGGLGVVAAGVAFGLAAASALARLLGDALFGVSAHDDSVLGLVTLVLLGTALLANGLPARRAARIDPMRSLRTE